MQFDQTPDQGETDAQPALGAIERMVNLGEEVKDVSEHFRGDADAAVAHAEYGVRAFARDTQAYAAAFLSELGGVVEKVGQHLRESRPIRLDVDWLVRQ